MAWVLKCITIILVGCFSIMNDKLPDAHAPSVQPKATPSVDGAGVQEDEDEQDEVSDMELADQVSDLLKQMEAAQIKERDQAEKELEALGPRVLDFLEPDENVATDLRERIQRVRAKLEKEAAEMISRPSVVTLSGSMTVVDAIKRINKQTGNNVRIPEGFETTLTNAIDFDLKKVSFWEAVDAVCKHGQLGVDPYGSMPGTLMLTPIQPAMDNQGNPINIQRDPLPSDQQSIYDVSVVRVDSSRNLANPRLNHCRVALRIRWEPRVRPISVDIPVADLKIIDEFDKEIALQNAQGVLSAIVQPEIPELEFSLPLPLLDRQVENLKSLSAKIKTVIPGRVETFKFKDVSQLEAGAELTRSGATVVYGGTEKNDDLFGATISLKFDETNRAFESHQSWVFDNECYLLDQNGKKVDNIGMQTVAQTETEVGIQYFFVENPLDYTIVYRTPSVIVELPVTINLKGIPLP